jgi:hypothetical protein
MHGDDYILDNGNRLCDFFSDFGDYRDPYSGRIELGYLEERNVGRLYCSFYFGLVLFHFFIFQCPHCNKSSSFNSQRDSVLRWIDCGFIRTSPNFFVQWKTV